MTSNSYFIIHYFCSTEHTPSLTLPSEIIQCACKLQITQLSTRRKLTNQSCRLRLFPELTVGSLIYLRWCCVLFTDFILQCQPRPQGAFPSKPGKSALGTRLLQCDCSFPDKLFATGRFQVGFVQNKSEIAL